MCFKFCFWHVGQDFFIFWNIHVCILYYVLCFLMIFLVFGMVHFRGPTVRGPICHFGGADSWAPDNRAPGPNCPGPNLPRTTGPRTTGPRGPTVRGPVVRGPTVRGPIVRGPICLEPRWHPVRPGFGSGGAPLFSL